MHAGYAMHTGYWPAAGYLPGNAGAQPPAAPPTRAARRIPLPVNWPDAQPLSLR